MDLKLFTSKAANTFAENRMLKFTILVLLAAVLILSVCVVTAMNKERVILVPPVINSKVVITGDKASEDYLREFTRYIVNLALTYNPPMSGASSANCLPSMIRQVFRTPGRICTNWPTKSRIPGLPAPFTYSP